MDSACSSARDKAFSSKREYEELSEMKRLWQAPAAQAFCEYSLRTIQGSRARLTFGGVLLPPSVAPSTVLTTTALPVEYARSACD